MPAADHPKHPVKLIDRQDSGRGIVDRLGQRLYGDVDDDPEGKRSILLDRALAPKGDYISQSLFISRYGAAVQKEKRFAYRRKIADPMGELDNAICALRFCEERA